MAEWNDLDRDFITEEMEDDDFGVEVADVEDPDHCHSRNVDINSARKRLSSKQYRSLSGMHRMKRDMMNMNEKARRQQLAQQFQDVLNMIPQGFLPKKVVRGEKAAVSKFESLNIFKKFVLYLTNKEAKLAAEKVELRRKNERLQVALQQRLQMKMAAQQEGTTIPLG